MEIPSAYSRNSNSKPPTLTKMESIGSFHETDTNTVSKVIYDNLVKEHKMQLQRAELVKNHQISSLQSTRCRNC